ncbi:MAG: hypothetical protein MUC36_02300 [Planctomycetes bacterium]|jgi:hypothetical protein|nr:hypothetical protein [Planctomycetota bacterium]
MSRRIALLQDGMEREAVHAVQQACAADGHEVVDAHADQPACIVAGLPPGERTVPAGAVECLAAAPAATPLVLLCQEQLVRGHVVLEAGRIHLFAPPHDSQSLQHRLQHVIAGRPPATADRVPFRADLSRAVERWSADYWCCVLSAAPAPGPDEVGKLLLVEKRPDGCFAVFPTESIRRQPTPLIDLLERLLLGDDRSMCQWLADLGGKGAVIAHDTEARELVVDLPPEDECAAWLLSSQRLPNVSQLPAGRPTCLPAHPGDILLVAVGNDAVQLLDADTMRGIVRAGGVAGARELQQRFGAMGSTNAILMLEART